MPIIIIKARPGKTTAEQALELIDAHPDGISIRELCVTLNRPVSMIQICLKAALTAGRITAIQEGMSLVYCLKSERIGKNKD
ncbi:winged helix-turn-helix domain-containing protein [Lusitaniella coriacea LEGE 07157]|uniref:Winged helix-turn-helix domain-containing protein n=1 Tax=Lusitaniella coriacea LEGE 07157 TaxID=945747 RepID=A0A8J7JFY3_9CYAN|nr:winged helix-turn-helix domain-containing protein [Lusitaniella coriacea]MBE9119115.1 winged helix-turn-helix domain-containing protein [Lusitaniella coriacea LEGE 07157]